MNLVAKGAKVRGAGLLGWGSQENRWGRCVGCRRGRGVFQEVSKGSTLAKADDI